MKGVVAFVAAVVVGDTLASECELAAARSGHVVGYRPLGLGCSRRMVTGPSSGVVGRNPLWQCVSINLTVS